MTETAFGIESMGVHVGAAPWHDGGREIGHLTVARWDAEQTDWASRHFGGEGTGREGFIPPNDVMFRQLKIAPYLVTTSKPEEHNLITTGGWNQVLSLGFGLIATGSYIGTGTRIGVGTATQAAASGDTNLIATTGPTARFFNLVTGNAVMAAGTAVRRASLTATFATGDANFAWQEWCIDQATTGSGTGAASGVMLNRAVSNQGTKVSGQTWTATANLDFT